MIKHTLFIIVMTISGLNSYSQYREPGAGYSWKLFDHTPLQELADAVSKEDTVRIRDILKDRRVNINLQEPIFGNTILLLAVENDKLLSTKALIEGGADINVRDSTDFQAIHRAVEYTNLCKNALAILELLVEHGANVNSVAKNGSFRTPLEGATDNLNCFKYLLNHGADCYAYSDMKYPVWAKMLNYNMLERIYVIKYVVVDKKMPIPRPIAYDYIDHSPRDIYSYLNGPDHLRDPKKSAAKKAVLDYLKKINYPKKGVYRK